MKYAGFDSCLPFTLPKSLEQEWQRSLKGGRQRFQIFPKLPDKTFGYVLHPADLAINKIMAAAGRRAVRDLVDLITVNDTLLPLGAVVWAAVDKSPGFTPEGLIAEIRRN